ncbi:MAG: hypothetical protein ACXWWN_04505 [Gemmatimonadales bacterium]
MTDDWRLVTRSTNLARLISGAVALHLALLILTRPVRCQELEPRAYAANPVNIGFALAAFGHSSGDVLLDPTVPVTDVSAKVQSVALGGGGTFALFGRTASASALLPYAWGTASGNVGEASRSEGDAPEVNLFNLQPLVNYNFGKGWAISTSPIISANWDAPSGEEWTVPLGGAISKTTAFNGRPMTLGAHYYHNLDHPTGAAANLFRLSISLLYPSRTPAGPELP